MPFSSTCSLVRSLYLSGLLLLGSVAIGRGDTILLDGAEQNIGEAPAARVSSRDPYDSILLLNSHLFAGNVLDAADGRVEHWVVYFCADWWSPCEKLLQPYSEQGSQWQERYNKNLLSAKVRFARVNCATDKVLCNEQGVEEYPTLVHYETGRAVEHWNGNRRHADTAMKKWLNKALVDIAKAGEPAGMAEALWSDLVRNSVPQDRLLDLFVFLFALALNCWMVGTNPDLMKKVAGSVPAALLQRASTSTPAEVSAGLSVERPAEKPAAQERKGIARHLPEEWAKVDRNLVL
eukprot:CAMPEP_0170600614 /NCGR_PEP_ID=MMETSP0224-20130122/17426_1 /TAXON_ID=285029 /ORGANISM="Togula jolla, Strain CCCM 725" /LENGTH=291 /DNA_ID=CAMNT_0010925347 /DNA_START=81 /DNA_END=956 /DNA_ORIENTATION=+